VVPKISWLTVQKAENKTQHLLILTLWRITMMSCNKPKKMIIFCMYIVFIVLIATRISYAETPIRDGFTIELGLGGAFTHAEFDGTHELNEFGHSMLTLSLGGYLDQDWAIMTHIAGTAAYHKVLDTDALITNQFIGLIGQYWVLESLYLSGGAGLALWGVKFSDSDDYHLDSGFALSARVGYSFLTLENHSFRVAIEVLPEFFDSRTVVATALNLEWQYF